VWSRWRPRSYFPAVSDLYEPLESPELVLHTDKERIDESAAVVLGWLKRRGLTPSS
jgi:adenylylsulfate kinase-like enzyme